MNILPRPFICLIVPGVGVRSYFISELSEDTSIEVSPVSDVIEVEILTAPGCAGCDKAKKIVQEVLEKEKSNLPQVVCKIVDVVDEPEVAAKYGILSTPAIAINGNLEFVGVPKEKKLIKKLAEYARR